MKHQFEISLNEVTGKKVVDVYGYVSNEFGDATFKITGKQNEDKNRRTIRTRIDGGVRVQHRTSTRGGRRSILVEFSPLWNFQPTQTNGKICRGAQEK